MEVLEGAYPAQYGDKFAAVVNISTRAKGGPAGADLDLRGGSFALADSVISAHTPIGGGGSLYAGARFFHDGRAIDPAGPGRRARCGQHDLAVHAAHAAAARRGQPHPGPLAQPADVPDPARHRERRSREHQRQRAAERHDGLADLPARARRPRRVLVRAVVQALAAARHERPRQRPRARRGHDVHRLQRLRRVLGLRRPHRDRLPAERRPRLSHRQPRAARRRDLRSRDDREELHDDACRPATRSRRPATRSRSSTLRRTSGTPKRCSSRTAGSGHRSGGSTTACAPTRSSSSRPTSATGSSK